MDLVVRLRESPPPGRQDIEIVERKGLGQPTLSAMASPSTSACTCVVTTSITSVRSFTTTPSTIGSFRMNGARCSAR